MKKVRFIYNPRSGDNRIVYGLDDIVSVYQRWGYTIVPYRLTFDCDDREVVRELDDTYDHILLSGGDGTINYMVNVMKNNGIDLPLAVLPAGTANDFANLLGIPSDIVSACKEILGGEVKTVDLGRVNDTYFVNVFSCGLFTDVSQRTPTLMKNTFGKLAYYFSSLGELPSFKKMQLTVRSHGEEIYSGSALIFFVFNGKTAGNLKIAYLSDIQDGLLDVLILRGDNIVETIRTVVRFLRHASQGYPRDVVHVKSDDITITSLYDETTDVDGQPGPAFPARISCEPGGLKVIVPRQRK